MKYRECLHYNYGAVCRAGLRTADVRDAELRLPCVSINDITGELACPKLEMPADRQAARAGGMVEAFAAMEAGRCPQCQTPIVSQRTVGFITSAHPGGHTLADLRRR